MMNATLISLPAVCSHDGNSGHWLVIIQSNSFKCVTFMHLERLLFSVISGGLT